MPEQMRMSNTNYSYTGKPDEELTPEFCQMIGKRVAHVEVFDGGANGLNICFTDGARLELSAWEGQISGSWDGPRSAERPVRIQAWSRREKCHIARMLKTRP